MAAESSRDRSLGQDLKREGTQVTARYIDLVSNGDMNLYIAHFDATQDEMDGRGATHLFR